MYIGAFNSRGLLMFHYSALIYTGTGQALVHGTAVAKYDFEQQLVARYGIYVCLWCSEGTPCASPLAPSALPHCNE